MNPEELELHGNQVVRISSSEYKPRVIFICTGFFARLIQGGLFTEKITHGKLSCLSTP